MKGQMKKGGRDENREVFIRWKEENDKVKVGEHRVEKWKEDEDEDRKSYGGIMTRKEEGKGGEEKCDQTDINRREDSSVTSYLHKVLHLPDINQSTRMQNE